MKWIIFLLTLLLPINAMATTYHVANSGGDYTTVAAANAVAVTGDTIALKCGDTFNENLTVVSGVTYNSYGSGVLPKILGFHKFGFGADYTTIENIYFRGTVGDTNVIEIYGGQNITIQNCTIDSNGINLITLINIGSYGSGRATYNISIIGCTGYGGGNTAGFNATSDNSGTYNILFQDNVLTGCYEAGLQAYSIVNTIHNIIFRGNTINGVISGHGINIGWLVYDSLVEKNYCYDNSIGGITIDSGVHDILVKNNICINNKSFNIGAQGSRHGQVYNLEFYNNTLVYGILTTGRGGFSFNIDSGGHDIIIKNNIIVNHNINNEEIYFNSLFTNVTSDYNLFYETLDTTARFNYLGVWSILSEWQALGHDTHSISADPMLNSDYTLKAGSPCINAGVKNLGVDTDYNGVKRRGTPDIGAYEYVHVQPRNCLLRNCHLG